MVIQVGAGNAGAVIVKDMGRFGQNIMKVGFCTEVVFKGKRGG